MSFGFGFGLPSQLYLIGSPTLNLNLAGATVLDPIVTFTRASSASYYNSLGLLSTATTNTPRFDYNPATLAAQGLLIEEQRTNLLTYSSEFDNAAWTKTNANVTVSASTTTSPSGASDADTLNSLSAASDNRVVQTATVANDSAVYTASVFVKKIATSYTRVDLRFINGTTTLNYAYAINLDSQTIFSSGGNIASSVGLTSVGNGWYRVSISAPNNSTGNTSAGISCYPSVDSAGATTTIGSVYIYGAQLEAGAFPTSYIPSTNTFTSRASTGSYFDSTGTLQSAAINVARNTYNPANLVAAPFLLLEEARTNSIRNSTMVGAIAGTPGTLPTNWIVTGGAGLTRTIVGTGTESGINYIDMRFSGTASSTEVDIWFESAAQVAALNGQTWNASAYCSLVGGSLTNVTSVRQSVVYYNNVATPLTLGTGTFTPASGSLALQRQSKLLTATDATTAFVVSRIDVLYTNGTAVDITLRIGLPQLEQGAYATSVIPNSPTFTSRASAATYYNSAGLLTSAATNVARYNYNPANLTQPANLILEAAATNLVTYSNEFAVPSIYATFNGYVSANVTTAPDGTVSAASLTQTGTNPNSAYIGATNAITFTSGVTYTYSCFFKANTFGKVYILLYGTIFNSGGANLAAVFDLSTGTISSISGLSASNVSISPAGNGWYRCSVAKNATTTITTSAASQFMRLYDTAVPGSSVFLWGLQIETGAAATTYVPSTNTFTSRASTGTYFDSAGVLQSAAINVARNTYNPANLSAAPFLLLEEARTNSIRNNTMQGAVAGTPGTLPTNWANILVSGLASTVVGTGTQNGITYLDVRIAGTPSVSTYYNLVPDILVAGSSGQTWTGSFWASLIAGSLTNTNANLEMRESDAAQGFLTNSITVLPITSTLTRYSLSRTLNNASTAFISVRFVWQVTNGLPVDFTLRIGLPQLEQGAYATSVIPTTTTALTRSADVSSSATTTRAADVYSQGALTRSADLSSSAQATRAADLSSVNTLSPWYNATEGTMYVESDQYIAGLAAAQYTGAELGDGTNNNLIQIGTQFGASNYQGLVNVGGAAQAVLLSPSGTSIVKRVLGYKANDFAMSINGQAVITDTSGSVPTVTSLGIGMRPSGIGQLNGHVRRITYYPRRLSNTELQSLTT